MLEMGWGLVTALALFCQQNEAFTIYNLKTLRNNASINESRESGAKRRTLGERTLSDTTIENERTR